MLQPDLGLYLPVLCPFIQLGPILSLLITGLNVEQKVESFHWPDAPLSFKTAEDVAILMLHQLWLIR